ncbi:MAG TPA: hypothetical protein VN881_03865 [Candidatus Acidoferrales bacterium]|nr:hypothetical protein [Candidatus Acidoferrales bacterium]
MMIHPFPFEWDRVWNSLGHFSQIFVFALGFLGVYTLCFGAFVKVRLRSLRKVHDDNPVPQSLARLKYRSANLQQLTLAMFYCFGFTFWFQIQAAFFTPENNRPVGLMVLENFSIYFSFAAFISLVFLALHLVQWFVSGSIRRAAVQLGE